MNITIRKLEDRTHEYFAYLKGLSGRAVYLLYFSDDIYGAITLNHFIQMLKNYFKEANVEISLHDSEIKITNEAIKEVLNNNVDVK